MHKPEYSQIVSPLYLVTRKKNHFHWGPEQQHAFVQIKQEIAHAVTLGPVRMGPKVAEATEREDGSNQLVELKAIQLALDIAEQDKWPELSLYTDS
ncbi:hypothetical protein HGM15179_019941 [Zosterops borbonicus]|uniref:RNase H type-1 domain-containing protein n=1 Tax=Zosterops borbonicus TaxID=364589 RepID=A0A8K1D784_9PASS|nr:hypothetical protein HGM15179_019941 [Zosterops borbonicus]